MPHFTIQPDTNLKGMNRTEVFLPLWIVFMIVIVPTMAFWYWSRLPRPGYCIKCGYNLTGNTSGICSECGTTTP